jgi:acetyltransferase
MRHEVQDLGSLFSPRSVAVVGASNSRVFAPGRRYVQALLSSGFKGAVYPVNTSGGEVLGLTAYTSILDIPDPVDQVICCIPASRTPQLVKDCVAKGVRLITLFNSGFTEIGSQEGAELEREVLAIARSGGVRVLGPNCMGLLSTDSGLAFFTFEAAAGRRFGAWESARLRATAMLLTSMRLTSCAIWRGMRQAR